ncbi:MAG: hypothetical protein JOY69_05955 [Candidatus Eremiobacteraeota bacterium]|nr:hypothetical protein [Candidatus Eremiobacteraeota bacterium]
MKSAVAAALISLFLAVSTVVIADAEAGPAKLYGSAWNPAIDAWLPDTSSGFDPWNKGQAKRIGAYDYFVCGESRAPAVPTQNLGYAGNACAPLNDGTAFVDGSAGPTKGHVVFDPAHHIVLYEKGCCAERGVVLIGDFKNPPKPVKTANLTGVHTMRGIHLGMTAAQVMRIYGSAQSHASPAQPGRTMLSYTTMRGSPTAPAGDTCGQFQNFSFLQNRLVSIQLLAGC